MSGDEHEFGNDGNEGKEGMGFTDDAMEDW